MDTNTQAQGNADIAAMFRPDPPTPAPPKKQNKRLSRVLEAIAFELRNHSMAGYQKAMMTFIRPKSQYTARKAEQVLVGLRRARALKKTRCQMAKRSRAVNQ